MLVFAVGVSITYVCIYNWCDLGLLPFAAAAGSSSSCYSFYVFNISFCLPFANIYWHEENEKNMKIKYLSRFSCFCFGELESVNMAYNATMQSTVNQQSTVNGATGPCWWSQPASQQACFALFCYRCVSNYHQATAACFAKLSFSLDFHFIWLSVKLEHIMQIA